MKKKKITERTRAIYRTLAMFLLLFFFLVTGGFWYLKSSIPDQLNVASYEDVDTIKLPFQSMVKDEVVYASVSAENTKIPEEKIKIQCSFLGFVPLKTVEIQQKELPQVRPGGNTIGIFMKTKGILVVGTGSVTDADGMEREPSLGILKSGDYIVKADGKEIFTKEEILEIVEKSQGKKIRLTVIRNGFEKECQILPVRMQDGGCKLGVWVRDDTQGLGTMTYVDGQKQYGALGHGISDVDTGLLMQIRDGKLYRASVGAVKKGEKGNPGELSGTIYYRDEQILGTITSNSETGIKGMLYAMPQELSGHSFVQTAYRQEVHTGNASIYCSIDGSVKEYTVEIEKINLSHRDINKSMVIRVKDQDLLEKTGGIVQGMSGSPILQDGKLIGAVTHVFVADPSRGYAIFAENMLEK